MLLDKPAAGQFLNLRSGLRQQMKIGKFSVRCITPITKMKEMLRY